MTTINNSTQDAPTGNPDLESAFALLSAHGKNPTWVGGEYVVVGRTVVRSMADAILILCA